MTNHKKSKWGTPQEVGVIKIRYKPTGEVKEHKFGVRRMKYNNELIISEAWGYDGGHPTDLNHPDNYEVVDVILNTDFEKSVKKE